MGFQVWITRLDNPPGTNSEGHYHAPCTICFILATCKYEYYSPWYFSSISKRLWASVSVFVSNISIHWVFILSARISPSSELISKSVFFYIEGIFFRPTFLFD